MNANPNVRPGVVTGRFGGASPVALMLGGFVLLLSVLWVVLAVPAHQLNLNMGSAVAIALPFALVGVVVARRQPRNVIGWIFLAAAALLIVAVDASCYLVLRYRLGYHGLPFGAAAVLLGLVWAIAAELLPLGILLFPGGRLPSPRWRPALYAYLLLATCWPIGMAVVAAGAISGHHLRVDAGGNVTAVTNPAGSSAWLGSVEAVVLPLIGIFGLLSVGSQIAKWRRSHGEQREQLKWLLGGSTVSIVAGTFSILTSTLDPNGGSTLNAISNLASFLLVALPLSMGVAILRYRLYEIDRLISRTLSYLIITGLLAGVFVGIVVLATDVLPFSSPVGVAASTLAAAALFNPLRLRVQRLVDRRFNRARYDAEAIVAAFTLRLRDAVDLDTVRGELLAAVDGAVQPAHASVWIRPPARRSRA